MAVLWWLACYFMLNLIWNAGTAEHQSSRTCGNKTDMTVSLSCNSTQWLHVMSELYSLQTSETDACVPSKACSINQYTSNSGLRVNCNGPIISKNGTCDENTSPPPQVCGVNAARIAVEVRYECLPEAKIFDICNNTFYTCQNTDGQISCYLATPQFPYTPARGIECTCQITGENINLEAYEIKLTTNSEWPEGLRIYSNNSAVWQAYPECASCTHLEIVNDILFLQSDLGKYDRVKVTYRDNNQPQQLVWLKIKGSGQSVNITCEAILVPPPPTTTVTTTTAWLTVNSATSTTSKIPPTIHNPNTTLEQVTLTTLITNETAPILRSEASAEISSTSYKTTSAFSRTTELRPVETMMATNNDSQNSKDETGLTVALVIVAVVLTAVALAFIFLLKRRYYKRSSNGEYQYEFCSVCLRLKNWYKHGNWTKHQQELRQSFPFKDIITTDDLTNDATVNKTNETSNEDSLDKTHEISNEDNLDETNEISNEDSLDETNEISNEDSLDETREISNETNEISNEDNLDETHWISNEDSSKETNEIINEDGYQVGSVPPDPNMISKNIAETSILTKASSRGDQSLLQHVHNQTRISGQSKPGSGNQMFQQEKHRRPSRSKVFKDSQQFGQTSSLNSSDFGENPHSSKDIVNKILKGSEQSSQSISSNSLALRGKSLTNNQDYANIPHGDISREKVKSLRVTGGAEQDYRNHVPTKRIHTHSHEIASGHGAEQDYRNHGDCVPTKRIHTHSHEIATGRGAEQDLRNHGDCGHSHEIASGRGGDHQKSRKEKYVSDILDQTLESIVSKRAGLSRDPEHRSCSPSTSADPLHFKLSDNGWNILPSQKSDAASQQKQTKRTLKQKRPIHKGSKMPERPGIKKTHTKEETKTYVLESVRTNSLELSTTFREGESSI